jgi:translation initiation factor 2B subunit (eIF-2B alpha/beta/delta family)
MLGADWISETQFTNKIGSALLVQLALRQNLPVYVAASTDKMLAQKFYPITVDDQAPGEILTTRSAQMKVKNRFFEAVPLSDKIEFITERGRVKHKTLQAIVDKLPDHR